ncbi:ATP-grasp domain-containing protein [Halorientalis pallida]|uniref:ATP-grasp domain-containing protein n=1 Tax=Halorientalis pallida TaxID=2479928 RepID=UPI003C6F2E22
MTSVLFTPAGSGMAVTSLKALNEHGDIRTVSTDIDDLSPGLHLADAGYIVPPFDDDEYMASILHIVETEDIDVVVPSLDPILKRFANTKDRFREVGARVMISPPETLTVTQDKWKTYERLGDTLPFPDSWIDIANVDPSDELFIKPRTGSGSEGIHEITSRRDLEFYFERVTDPIVQEYLPGPEYTIDCLTDGSGDLLACVPRKRLDITSGISTKVEVVDDPALVDIARGVADELEFVGPFFVQVKADDDGDPRITEVGARTAGTMCREFVTPSLQYLAVQQLLGGSVPEPEVEFGRRLSRYWCEQSFDGDVAELHRY